MIPGRLLNARIRAEIDRLVKMDILTADEAEGVRERYPATAWDLVALVRIFTVLGGCVAALGAVLVLQEPLLALVRFLHETLNWWLVAELGLAAVGAAFLFAGSRLRHARALPRTGEIVQLLGCVALQGMTVVLAEHYATGSENWPSLVGVQTVMLIGIAYLTTSTLVLWYGCIHLFFWFGAQTGYMAGWGCYWLGMTYPVRYLVAGGATLMLSWLHATVVRGRWSVFSRVYAHFGLLVGNLAFWFLSLFGYYEAYDFEWSDKAGERLAFTLLWAMLSVASMFVGAKFGLKLARAYGLTFGIVNLYTFYFQFVVANSAALWFVHLLIAGGSLLALGLYLERHHRAKPNGDEPSESAPPA